VRSEVRHQSVLLDLSLIFLTVLVVLSRQSGYCMQLLRGLPQPDSAVLSACLT
jgi:hypothetical protein